LKNKTKQNPQKRVGGVAQGVGPEFKPQYCQKRKKERKNLNEGVTQAVEYLPWKCKALNSNLSTTKKKKRKSSSTEGPPYS
jgi:hypothetical protein